MSVHPPPDERTVYDVEVRSSSAILTTDALGTADASPVDMGVHDEP